MNTACRLTFLTVAFVLGAVSSAQAAMSAQVNPETNVVEVVGDSGSNRINVADGFYDPPTDNYGVKFYDLDGGEVTAGDGCIQSAGPVVTTYCGDNTVQRVEMALGEGDDVIESYQNAAYVQLKQIVADLGPGVDETESDFVKVQVGFLGGPGEDRLAGGTIDDYLDGGPDNDYLYGAAGPDELHGGDGADEILGLGGDDKLFGEAGNDSIAGGDENDTIDGGPGTDSIQGDGSSNSGSGSDTILVDDGETDGVFCGLGGDTVAADQLDVVDGSCEAVTRSGGGGGPTPPGGGGTPPGGQPPGTPPPAGADTVAPAFTTAPTLGSTRFRAATSGAMIAQTARGTTLTLGLSEASTLRFTVRRKAAGRRVRGRCVAPRRANRRRPRCTRRVQVGSTVTRSVPAGEQRLRFTGRSGGRALRPGSYTLVVVAIDAAGNRSRTANLAFRIVR